MEGRNKDFLNITVDNPSRMSTPDISLITKVSTISPHEKELPSQKETQSQKEFQEETQKVQYTPWVMYESGFREPPELINVPSEPSFPTIDIPLDPIFKDVYDKLLSREVVIKNRILDIDSKLESLKDCFIKNTKIVNIANATGRQYLSYRIASLECLYQYMVININKSICVLKSIIDLPLDQVNFYLTKDGRFFQAMHVSNRLLIGVKSISLQISIAYNFLFSEKDIKYFNSLEPTVLEHTNIWLNLRKKAFVKLRIYMVLMYTLMRGMYADYLFDLDQYMSKEHLSFVFTRQENISRWRYIYSSYYCLSEKLRDLDFISLSNEFLDKTDGLFIFIRNLYSKGEMIYDFEWFSQMQSKRLKMYSYRSFTYQQEFIHLQEQQEPEDLELQNYFTQNKRPKYQINKELYDTTRSGLDTPPLCLEPFVVDSNYCC